MNDANNTIINDANTEYPEVKKMTALGGEFNLQWDDQTPMTTHAHGALLSQLFQTSGIFARLVDSFPLKLSSPNAPKNASIVGTALLGIINGASRYRHFDNLKGDCTTADVFGIDKFMSSDSVRRNFEKLDNQKGLEWIWKENLRILEPLIDQDYILDLDPTVKPLYGHQEGAEIGYNPQKRGRPSHCYHTLCLAKARVVLGVTVHPGNDTSGKGSLEMLNNYFQWIGEWRKPKLIRGDVGFGNETMFSCCESNLIPYLFKIKRSSSMKALFKKLLQDADIWEDAGLGWQCTHTRERLQGWSKERDVFFVRRRLEQSPKHKQKAKSQVYVQTEIPGMEYLTSDDTNFADGYEWHILVSNFDAPKTALPQLYRDRGDCENIFDEQKNQWGWGGFVTQDLKRTAILAGMSAYVSNIWNIFSRLGVSPEYKEAKTSRNLLQQGIAKISCHSRKKTVTFYTSGKPEISKIYRNITHFLDQISTATQLTAERRWQLIVYYAFRHFDLIYKLFPPEIAGQLCLPLR